MQIYKYIAISILYGDIMVIETKVYKKNQTTIPSVYRKKYNVKPDDIVEWEENDRGEIVVSFRKRLSFRDMIGAGTLKTPTNAVQLEKELYK